MRKSILVVLGLSLLIVAAGVTGYLGTGKQIGTFDIVRDKIVESVSLDSYKVLKASSSGCDLPGGVQKEIPTFAYSKYKMFLIPRTGDIITDFELHLNQSGVDEEVIREVIKISKIEPDGTWETGTDKRSVTISLERFRNNEFSREGFYILPWETVTELKSLPDGSDIPAGIRAYRIVPSKGWESREIISSSELPCRIAEHLEKGDRSLAYQYNLNPPEARDWAALISPDDKFKASAAGGLIVIGGSNIPDSLLREILEMLENGYGGDSSGRYSQTTGLSSPDAESTPVPGQESEPSTTPDQTSNPSTTPVPSPTPETTVTPVPIPEFPTVVLPLFAVMALLLLLQRKR